MRIPGPIETLHEQMQPNGFGVTLTTVTDSGFLVYHMPSSVSVMIPFYR